VVCFGGAAWVRRRWPKTALWKPRPSAGDRVNRPGRVAALIFFALGTAVLVRAPFAYDEDFLNVRGPLVLAFMLLGMVLFLVVTVQGRWWPLTRQLEALLNLAMSAFLIWVLVAGPVFQSPQADRTAKLALALIVAVTLIDLIVKARRGKLVLFGLAVGAHPAEHTHHARY
jgi:uncharacterized membrane protein YphA (DoxX/SURF4 family)